MRSKHTASLRMMLALPLLLHPRWSPDGRWLVVTTDRWGFNDELDFLDLNFQPYGELAAIRLEDLHVVCLTDNTWEEGQAFWLRGTADRILGDK